MHKTPVKSSPYEPVKEEDYSNIVIKINNLGAKQQLNFHVVGNSSFSHKNSIVVHH